jgi:hypothetical protein
MSERVSIVLLGGPAHGETVVVGEGIGRVALQAGKTREHLYDKHSIYPFPDGRRAVVWVYTKTQRVKR